MFPKLGGIKELKKEILKDFNKQPINKPII